MTEHLSFDQLCDIADGALSGPPLTAARAHLATCAECSAQLGELTQLHADAAALPRAIQPPDDLWLDIKRDLAPVRRIGVQSPWRMRQLIAAGLIVAATSSALTAVALRNGKARTAETVATSVDHTPLETTSAALPARLASDEDRYSRSVRALQATLDERRDSLAPSTVATVERSLRIADSAIAEAREALAQDPANTALARLFASNYERKIDLLRRATELAPRT